MPAAPLRAFVDKFLRERDPHGAVPDGPVISALEALVSEEFDVSSDAARVRLSKLGILN